DRLAGLHGPVLVSPRDVPERPLGSRRDRAHQHYRHHGGILWPEHRWRAEAGHRYRRRRISRSRLAVCHRRVGVLGIATRDDFPADGAAGADELARWLATPESA